MSLLYALHLPVCTLQPATATLLLLFLLLLLLLHRSAEALVPTRRLVREIYS